MTEGIAMQDWSTISDEAKPIILIGSYDKLLLLVNIRVFHEVPQGRN